MNSDHPLYRGVVSLPAEVKLEIIRYLSVGVINEPQQFYTLESVRQVIHTINHDGFCPSIRDLVRLHFVEESVIFALGYEPAIDMIRAAQPGGGVPWMAGVHVWLHNNTNDPEYADLERLHWLSFVYNQIHDMLNTCKKLFNITPDLWYKAAVDLWGYLNSKNFGSRIEYISSMTQHQATRMLDLIDIMAGELASRSKGLWARPHQAIWRLGNSYSMACESEEITFDQFIDSGAFKTCLSHYFHQLTPNELSDIFKPDRLTDALEPWQERDIPLLEIVDVAGDPKRIRLAVLDVPNEPVEVPLGKSPWAKSNIYWAICWILRYSEAPYKLKHCECKSCTDVGHGNDRLMVPLGEHDGFFEPDLPNDRELEDDGSGIGLNDPFDLADDDDDERNLPNEQSPPANRDLLDE